MLVGLFNHADAQRLEDALVELLPFAVVQFRKTQRQVGVHHQPAVGIDQHEQSAQLGPQASCRR